MRVAEHVEQLLKQGRKPKELLELGFPKRVVIRVNRQLKAEKAAQHQRVPKTGGRAKLAPEPVTAPPEPISTADEGMTSLRKAIDDLRKRIEVLESTCRSRVEDNGNASVKLGLAAEEARVTCLSCQKNFPRAERIFDLPGLRSRFENECR